MSPWIVGRLIKPGTITAGLLASGTLDFGSRVLAIDVIAESTAAAGVTIDGLRIKDAAVTPVAGGVAIINASANATGESDVIVGANLADAWTYRTSALTFWTLSTTTATPGIAESFARTGAGNAHSIAATINSASAALVGLAVSATQLTTARTSGAVIGVKSTVTSLTGDTAGVDYSCFEAAVAVGDAGADHFCFTQGAGFDAIINSSAAATGETDWLVGANLASALELRGASLTYLVLRSTTATPGIDETFTLTATGDAHNIQAVVNSATGVVQALDVGITTVTTVHSSGLLSAIRASTTSLAGDTGGDFVCLELASTDGGGTTPFHSGIYSASALDALVKVSADGMGGFVLGATMTISPEAAAESGYFRVNVGSTVYQVPIYAA